MNGEELKNHETRVRWGGTTGQERSPKPTEGNKKVSGQSSGRQWKK